MFKGRHFTGIMLLLVVSWYYKYNISYRELQEMLTACGVNAGHTTFYRWVQLCTEND
ncbi:IS6 family transposase [Morganella morganii]|nr:IS6 family transposase [Morganella morganii]